MASSTSAPESPLGAYIEAARRRLVSLQGPGETTWAAVVERGLGEAYALSDLGGLARVVQFLVNLLEAEGRFDDALREVDQALAVARQEPRPRASLEALKAALCAGRGDVETALGLANSAGANAIQHLDGDPRAKALALVETVRMVTLAGASPWAQKLHADLVSEGRTLDQLFIMSWEIAFAAATSSPSDVRPSIRRFRAIARRKQAGFREAEIPVLDRWLAITAGASPTLEGGHETHTHSLAHWRMACLDFWQAVSHRNWAAAEIALNAMDRRRKRLGSDSGPPEPWVALLAAAAGDKPVASLSPPPANRLVLNNLAAALAGAYATALGGSKIAAAEWLGWTAAARKRGIQSSLELPVSVERVLGLLAVRAGNPGRARKYLDAAAAAGEGGRIIEAALARLQLCELATKSGLAIDEHAGQQARRHVAELGFDPLPHLYAIHNAWDTGTQRAPKALLTQRETEVLRQLAEGKSYKEAAACLGISWTTVQTQAHRVYEKLSVSNRVAAIAEARRLGLL